MSRTANGKISKRSLRVIRRYYKKTCQYCFDQSDELTFDHIVPRAIGGKTNLFNITVACRTCNGDKAAHRLPLYQERELLRKANEAREHTLAWQERFVVRLSGFQRRKRGGSRTELS